MNICKPALKKPTLNIKHTISVLQEAVPLCVLGAMETSPNGNTSVSLCSVTPEASVGYKESTSTSS